MEIVTLQQVLKELFTDTWKLYVQEEWSLQGQEGEGTLVS